MFDYQLIHRSFVGPDGRASGDRRVGARALSLFALERTSSLSLGALECSWLPPAIALRGPRLCGERGSPLQRDDGDPTAPAQRMGADRDPGDRPPLAGHLGDHRYEAMIAFCSQHPLEVVLSAFGLFPAHDLADPLWRDRMANLATVATLDPVEALQMTVLCLDALYHL